MKSDVVTKLVEAFNVNEAVEKLQLDLDSRTLSNLTGAFTRSKKESITDFIVDYVENDKISEDKLYYVVLTKPVDNSKSKPFKVENFSTPEQRKYKIGYELVGVDSKVRYDVKNNKPDAVLAAKKIVTEEQEDVAINVIKQVIAGNAITSIVKFAPSKNMKEGSFAFFYKKESYKGDIILETVTEDSLDTKEPSPLKEKNLADAIA